MEPFFCEHVFFFTHQKGCWSSSCCSQSSQATKSFAKSYWSLMAPWLLGISRAASEIHAIHSQEKGLSGQRFGKRQEVWKIDSKCAADFRDRQAPRVCGRTAAHMLCCREPLAALLSLQMKAAEKGENLVRLTFLCHLIRRGPSQRARRDPNAQLVPR